MSPRRTTSRSRRINRRKAKRTPKRPPPREPNELELMLARGMGRLLDFGDKVLAVAEEDPDRVLRMVEGVVDGVRMTVQAVAQQPDAVKKFVRDESMKVIARAARKKLNESR